ncbi:MAG: peptide chain release factor N(5)-glutamine methyltransferase [Ruminococcaceae bacterium]|nr:peptide chain release factor N(5)-glutamine methyltransferase [Oscillospiraceae bacterium]
MTIFEAYNKTKKKLEAAGIEDFVFEAKQIIKHITGFTAPQILSNYNKNLTEFQETNLVAITRQREIRYPLQYIFGEWDFYGRPFFVGPGVLVPRADTETVVEECIDFLKKSQGKNVLDLCAGSGAIGITLAKEVADSRVTMVEKFPEAARYAERNIKRNNSENAAVLEDDVLAPTAEYAKYDLIVSNPPYIPANEMSEISPETRFEPETALLAEDGGMQFYKAIIENYTDYLTIGGMICFEVGKGESEAVAKLLKNKGFSDIKIKKDLGGIERAVSATKIK